MNGIKLEEAFTERQGIKGLRTTHPDNLLKDSTSFVLSECMLCALISSSDSIMIVTVTAQLFGEHLQKCQK